MTKHEGGCGRLAEPRMVTRGGCEWRLRGLAVVSLLAVNRWSFRLHATYDESISRMLNVFEEVNREIPFKGTKWFFDHCETISDRSLDRVKRPLARASCVGRRQGRQRPLCRKADGHEHRRGADASESGPQT